MVINDFMSKTLDVNDHALVGANLVHDNSDPLIIPSPGLSQITLFFKLHYMYHHTNV